jgi:hypothetical protein
MDSSLLPASGRIACNLCHRGQPFDFDRTRTTEGAWRITNNPLAWGSTEPEIMVLGFSKGPTQAGALASTPHDQIAFKGGRANLAKILHHIGLLPEPDGRLAARAIADPHGRFHFGSLIRCTVEQNDARKGWSGTGGGMLDKFVATPFGQQVLSQCSTRFLAALPTATRLVVMLGMGSKGNYVTACRKAFATARPGQWRMINEVAYTDGRITVVHTEHFASQGRYIPDWLSGGAHERGRLGDLAREGVQTVFG